MKNKITSIIIFLIVIGIIATALVLGLVFLQEYIKTDENEELAFVENSVNKNDEEQNNTVEEDIKTPEIVENPISKIEDTNIKNVNYDNVKVNKYFYNQLEEPSKTIYKAFTQNKENMKTGTYQIELGTSFSDILKQENGQEELGKYYQSAIEAYTYDNPDVFYLNPKKMYLNIETTTRGKNVTYNVFINNGNESNYLIDEFNSKEQVDNAIAEIENVKNQVISNRTGNAYEDMKMVHDYLIDNISYDSSISKPNIYNIYGALINKECVCEGYARAYKYILDELNIPCILVIGIATNGEGNTENHAWNYVKLNNSWYAVDTTWDDPVIIGGGILNKKSKYRYFLKGKETIDQDHITSGQFTEGGKEFAYPILNETDFE